jgi:hypothetical protein
MADELDRTVCVDVLGAIAGKDFWHHGRLVDFIAKMQAMLDSVPEEHRADVMVEMDGYTDFDNYPMGRLTVNYERPETPADAAARVEAEADHWRGQVANLRNDAERIRRNLEEAGVDPASLGLTADDGGYTVRRA